MSTQGPRSGGGGWVVRPGVPARGASMSPGPGGASVPPAGAPGPNGNAVSGGSANNGGIPQPSAAMVQAAPLRVVRALQASALFKSFTETGIQILATVAQEKTLPPGTPLFVEHMIGEALYVIAEGQIRIGVRGPDGRERRLAILDPGESLGEAALLRAGPRLCSATAETHATVLEIARRDVAALQRTKPQACLKLMMGIVEILGLRMRDADPELRSYVAWRAGLIP